MCHIKKIPDEYENINSDEFNTLEREKYNTKLMKTIAHGAFGKVYKTKIENEFFAVKKILIDKMTENVSKEIQIIQKKLNNEFIVKFYDYWTEYNDDFEFLYITMELCAQSLKDMTTLKISFPVIIDYLLCCVIFRQLLQALDYLYSINVMHRDIKPNNILIKYYDDHAKIKLCDFGLAKVMISTDQENSPQVGTLKNMAPELKDCNYNNKIDIFSMGKFVEELFKNCFIYKNSLNQDNLSDLTRIFLRKINNLEKIINIGMLNEDPKLRLSCFSILNAIVEFKFHYQEIDNYLDMKKHNKLRNQNLIFHDSNCTGLKFLDKKYKIKSFDDEDLIMKGMIGYGANGRVYKVVYKHKYFALKKVYINNKKVTREPEVMELLKSEHVPMIHHYWTQVLGGHDYLFIQMELCDIDLGYIIKKKNNTISDPIIDYKISCDIFEQVLQKMDFVHSKNILYRDFKSSNILVINCDDHAQLKLGDFGLSKVFESESQTHTAHVGTIKYQAPEIRTSKYDEKVDIYSAGIVAKELFQSVIDKLKRDQSSSNDQLSPFDIDSIIHEIETTISNMNQRDPSQRPSASALLDTLKQWQFNKIDMNTLTDQLSSYNKEEYPFLKFLHDLY